MELRRLGLALTVVLLAPPLLVACGDGGSVDVASSSTSTSTESTTTSPFTSTSTTTTTVAPTTTTDAPVRPAVAPPPRPSPSVTVQPQVLPFSASIKTVTAQDLYASWRPGCPVHVEQLRAIDVTHFGNDGAVHTGRVIVAANVANQIVDIFRDLHAARFPIQRMEPVDVYGGDDIRSIRANNTSAFNCRAVTGGTGWSEHAFGRAIDINPLVNPYVKGGTVIPPESAPYTDRSRRDQGMIHPGDAVVEAFAARGWAWGGYWTSLKDYQHFSTTGR